MHHICSSQLLLLLPAICRSEHTLPVTSIHLGCGEGSALLATASLDRSVKLWSLATGLLRTITLPAGVTSVTLDAGEHVLLAGCVDGSIWEAPLAGQQLASPAAAGGGGSSGAAGASDAAAAAAAAAGVLGGPGSCCYEGHSKAISSLAITPDGEQLVSGGSFIPQFALCHVFLQGVTLL
jgi:WD40 repeat protein